MSHLFFFNRNTLIVSFYQQKEVVDIDYDIDNPTVLETTEIDVTTIRNKNAGTAEQPGSGVVTYTEEFTDTREFHWRNATAVKGDAQLKTGIPFIAEGTLAVGLSETYYIGRKKTKSNATTKSFSFTIPAVAAAGTKVHTKGSVKKHEIEIPMTAIFKDGSTEEGGIFKSVHFEVDIDCKEEPVTGAS